LYKIEEDDQNSQIKKKKNIGLEEFKESGADA